MSEELEADFLRGLGGVASAFCSAFWPSASESLVFVLVFDASGVAISAPEPLAVEVGACVPSEGLLLASWRVGDFTI